MAISLRRRSSSSALAARVRSSPPSRTQQAPLGACRKAYTHFEFAMAGVLQTSPCRGPQLVVQHGRALIETPWSGVAQVEMTQEQRSGGRRTEGREEGEELMEAEKSGRSLRWGWSAPCGWTAGDSRMHSGSTRVSGRRMSCTPTYIYRRQRHDSAFA